MRMKYTWIVDELPGVVNPFDDYPGYYGRMRMLTLLRASDGQVCMDTYWYPDLSEEQVKRIQAPWSNHIDDIRQWNQQTLKPYQVEMGLKLQAEIEKSLGKKPPHPYDVDYSKAKLSLDDLNEAKKISGEMNGNLGIQPAPPEPHKLFLEIVHKDPAYQMVYDAASAYIDKTKTTTGVVRLWAEVEEDMWWSRSDRSAEIRRKQGVWVQTVPKPSMLVTHTDPGILMLHIDFQEAFKPKHGS